MKFRTGIMGTNWLHLQDGSGSPEREHDLTITTDETLAVGDVVTFRGFGGYVYPLIVEKAAVAK